MKERLTIALLCCSFSTLAAPQIIAHRAGTDDAPENTLVAIDSSLKNGANAIWITLQLSKDQIPVLYRPSALEKLTDKTGKVSDYSQKELANVDAGWNFGDNDHPFRGKGIHIPSLEEVLKQYPDTFFYLDIKSPDAEPTVLAKALSDVLNKNNSLKRIRVYSTEAKYLAALPAEIPRFETRDETRSLLANISLSHTCNINAKDKQPRWYGLELKRDVEVVESFTLGEGRSKATLTWDEEAMKCFRSQGNAHIIFFGINNEQDYQQAVKLKADGVMVNSPAKFKSILKQRKS
ncbi:glycerophosphodiester phosphodiesterase [Budviciaceae bacterium BWR-B9]|uniref:Glycerophosphodiester phosphodiesterase n=1 Tax=Limnobaculum allomyrinae TaxID=2791986 RepID=A0ABS1IRU5_9GAMM|nr:MULTISPECIES: glycerophosphodiester phosphodiesterase family protein [Limnobaculum]MBK5144025.1 glycerophosphodiester phosphodiesterase [Limnobaculum allomyrinae]MBV7691684.1 glycerophosphodiester phosphodiesterase [Limnobaculum sp. M2-1]